jgi:molecular chaperone GrpE
MSNKENSKISAAVNGSEGGEEKILELEQKLGEYMNGWQRAQADYQNLQKETAKWKEDFVQYAKADFILELLPIYSHYKTALNHIPVADQTKDWVQGIKHIFSQLQALFKKLGVEEMVVVGETFDHNFHEAIARNKNPSQPDEVILRKCSRIFIRRKSSAIRKGNYQ